MANEAIDPADELKHVLQCDLDASMTTDKEAGELKGALLGSRATGGPGGGGCNGRAR